MATFDCLPFDVIDYILNSDCISYIDVCRLSSVSKIFHCIAKSNKLWRKKYANTWPDLSALYDAQNTDWRLEFRVRFDFKKLVSEKLSEISAEYYHLENVSYEAFSFFKDIAGNHPLGYDFVLNEFEDIIYNSDSHLKLTQRYYAQRALRYMRHAQLEILWRNYFSQSSSKLLSLVEGLCLVSRWCQPTVPKCTSQVAAQIEDIAKLVLEKIKLSFPQHPVVKKGILQDDVLSTSLWSTRQCKDILYYINEIMFEDLKFSCYRIDYYTADTTFIDKVLTKKSGISITLAIIYSAVAAKLGVACSAVNIPQHFLLKWLEHPGRNEEEKYTFIDVNEKGAFKKYADLSYMYRDSTKCSAVPAIKVLTSLAWYLVEFSRQRDDEDYFSACNALELLCLFTPHDMENKLLLARLYMERGINGTETKSLLEEIADNDPTSQLSVGYMYQTTLSALESQIINHPPVQTNPKLRDKSSNVKFAVGMIMKHKKFRYRCVIFGWDYTCTASEDWITRMGVYKLLHKDKQPFYNVLVDDGTNRYAAQENLMIDQENKQIAHTKIGRYFESYHGNYYLPNEQTLSEYPQDIEGLKKALQPVQEE